MKQYLFSFIEFKGIAVDDTYPREISEKHYLLVDAVDKDHAEHKLKVHIAKEFFKPERIALEESVRNKFDKTIETIKNLNIND